MKKLLRYVLLPKTIYAFEAKYLARLNRLALAFFALHVPALTLFAWANHTNPVLAWALSMVAIAGPVAAFYTLKNPRTVSTVHGIAAMVLGALLVHFGQGPMQIAMHFYFFAVIAMLGVFANPQVIVAATATVALHHVVLAFLLPRSAFDYEASLGVVALHGAFVVAEAIATSYIARVVFDNVIDVERIVGRRTAALDDRNHHLRLVLDNVDQGFVTVDANGILAVERSRAFDTWFGKSHETLFDAFAARCPAFAERTIVAWEALQEHILPLELLLAQMPTRMTAGDAHLDVAYIPIGTSETPDRFVVVVTNVTEQVNQSRSESEQREVLHLERLLGDRGGVEDYFDEASTLVERITQAAPTDLVLLKRQIHTLKGNSAIFGLESVASICHELESHLAEGGTPPVAELAKLSERWVGVARSLERLIGVRGRVIELDASEHAALEADALHVSLELWRKIHSLRLEPTKRRLEHFGEQAKRIASRLQKELDIKIEDTGLRVDPKHWASFWSAFVHAVRNAVDHGIELPAERTNAGKSSRGRIVLRTFITDERFVVEVEDDGRGINWRRVEEKAVAAGLSRNATDALHTALFFDGVSTATEITEVSGRGVGMGALLDATKHAGGEISVHSKRGYGTRVRMTFPVAAMTPDDKTHERATSRAVAA